MLDLMTEDTMDGVVISSTPALFSLVKNHIDVEKSRGRLMWIDEITGPFGISVSSFASENVEAALSFLRKVIKTAYFKRCDELLKFLFAAFADAVRDEGKWRVLFGESGIVDECLKCFWSVDGDCARAWHRSGLRLLSNCCCDPEEDGSGDENRASVMASLPLDWLLHSMEASLHRVEAVTLQYNICLYDEDSREAMFSAGGVSILWEIINSVEEQDARGKGMVRPVCEMLTWAPEGGFHHEHETFQILMAILDLDLTSEDVVSLIEVALHALKAKGIPHDPGQFLNLLHFLLYTCFSVPKSQNLEDSIPLEAFSEEEEKQRFLDDDEELLVKARESLITELIALSARSDTDLTMPSTDSPLYTLFRWISNSHFQLRICGLSMLGNFAYQSRALSTSLIEHEKYPLPKTMNHLLKTEINGMVLKAALGAVQKFAKEIEHRTAFGHAGILETISASWIQGANLPLQQAALFTTRSLISESLENVDIFLRREVLPGKALFLLLLETFLGSEVQETRLDIAWTLERLWRSIHVHVAVNKALEVGSDEEKNSSARATITWLLQQWLSCDQQIYPRILEPFMVILKSEDKSRIIAAIYTLVLMLREERDYNAIYNVLCQGEGRDVLLTLIQDIANLKAQANLRVLVQKLRNHYSHDVGRTANLTDIWQAFKRETSLAILSKLQPTG